MHEDHSRLGAGAYDTLSRAHEALERCTGAAPVGWRAPDGLLTRETHEHLRRIGYAYDASAMDSDLPYAVATSEGELIEIPQFPMLRDVPYYRQFRSADSVLQAWSEEFDAIYDDGLLFSLTVTCRGDVGSARGVRLKRLDELIAHITSRPGVHVTTHAALAGWCAGRAPAAPIEREIA
jgi:peptidoglycan/xylan/chitin deacetylase (PgdA/CDA1 family)